MAKKSVKKIYSILEIETPTKEILTDELAVKMKQDFKEIVKSNLCKDEKRKKMLEYLDQFDLSKEKEDFLKKWIQSQLEPKNFIDINRDNFLNLIKLWSNWKENRILKINKEGLFLFAVDWIKELEVKISKDMFDSFKISNEIIFENHGDDFEKILDKFPIIKDKMEYIRVSFGESMEISNKAGKNWTPITLKVKLNKIFDKKEEISQDYLKIIDRVKEKSKSNKQFVEIDKKSIENYIIKGKDIGDTCTLNLLSPNENYFSIKYDNYNKNTELKLSSTQFNYKQNISKVYLANIINVLFKDFKKNKCEKIRFSQNQENDIATFHIQLPIIDNDPNSYIIIYLKTYTEEEKNE